MNPLAHIRHTFSRMDWWMFMAVLLLVTVGIMFIFSATYQSEDAPVSSLYKKQIMWAFVGIACYLFLTAIDYDHLGESSWWIFAVGVILLILVLLVGRKVYGAYRWLSLFGVQVQPSEFAKLATLIMLAKFWSRPGQTVDNPHCIWQSFLIVGIPFFLIFKEPDLGTAAVLLPMMVVIMFVAGVPIRTLLILGGVGLLLLPFGWFALGDYQHERLLVFLDPGRDPLGAGWNKIQSEIAVGSGGLTGKGYLEGTQNILGFLPRTVAPTDFIYSVIAEETGFMGSVFVLLLYGILVAEGVRAGLRSRDKFGRLLAVGMVTLLFSHVVVNVAMTVGLMPITGLPLPLISYGGSFMVSTMIGLGIIQSVYVRRPRRG